MRYELHPAPTKLERFLRTNRIEPAHVAAHSRVARQTLGRIRLHGANPSLDTIRSIVRGVNLELEARGGTPCTVLDLFDFE